MVQIGIRSAVNSSAIQTLGHSCKKDYYKNFLAKIKSRHGGKRGFHAILEKTAQGSADNKIRDEYHWRVETAESTKDPENRYYFQKAYAKGKSYDFKSATLA